MKVRTGEREREREMGRKKVEKGGDGGGVERAPPPPADGVVIEAGTLQMNLHPSPRINPHPSLPTHHPPVH